jgi:hypothetical protein
VKLHRFGKVQAGGFSFGLDVETVVAELRRLADGIEAKTVALQSASETNTATLEDFQMVEFTLTYAAQFKGDE